jgi:hypothetical protein
VVALDRGANGSSGGNQHTSRRSRYLKIDWLAQNQLFCDGK